MTPEQWRQIEELYQAARSCQPNQRAALLECTDWEIRSRVERMLEIESGSDILSSDAGDVVPDATKTVVAPGAQLGPYKIEQQVGAGGMGRVYRAVDTRLGRVVAIKIAAERYSERFQREARAISTLNHPNICTLYDVGPNYLVMEFIEGVTLAAEIKKGPVPMESVLQYGAQIANALAEAHALGIVHRDLKPSNVMLTRHGIKVLDFGLAKISAASNSDSETGLTETGGVMGTPAYMAPEQVQGREPVGPAADLFALGLVLYEMVKGQPPVPGVSVGSALANGTPIKIPTLSARSRAPQPLVSLIWQLIEPVPEHRPASAAEVRDRLERLARDFTGHKHRHRTPLVAAILVLLSVAAVQFWRSGLHNVSPIRALSATRVVKLTSFPGDETDPALSPDGHFVAFSWNGGGGGNFGIYTLALGSGAPQRLTWNPAKDMSPAWSPDGTQIAFLRLTTVSKGSLVVVPSSGGPERVLCEMNLREDIYRAMRPFLAWTPEGNGIVFTTTDEETRRAGLYLTDLQNPAPRQLLPAREGTIGITSPAFTRDGKWMAYTEIFGPYQSRLFVRPVAAGLRFEGHAIQVSGPEDTLVGSPVWSPNGKRLLYTQDAQILEWSGGQGRRQVHVQADRVLGMSAIWLSEEKPRIVTADYPSRELYSIHLRPGGLEVSGSLAAFGASASTNRAGDLRFSPDGKHVAFTSNRSGAYEVWLADGDGRDPHQLTHLNSSMIGFPRWTRDGNRIAFHSWKGDRPQVFTVIPERPGEGTEQLTTATFGAVSPSWSADAKYVYFGRISGGSRVLRLSVQGGAVEDLFEGSGGMTTPDGHGFLYFKVGQPGIFLRSVDGDPATNPEEKLVDDYKAPGDDLNPFPDGVYYISWNGDGKPRAVRFYNYAQKKSRDVFVLPGLVGSPQVLTVSPDRSYMIFNRVAGEGTDLTMIEF